MSNLFEESLEKITDAINAGDTDSLDKWGKEAGIPQNITDSLGAMTLHEDSGNLGFEEMTSIVLQAFGIDYGEYEDILEADPEDIGDRIMDKLLQWKDESSMPSSGADISPSLSHTL
ncbi:MAG: hypothetical protein WBA02_10680 [Jannaschia helgolandensis]|uniref:hypothetical protein n=1 Tax=Jannaschia helgolandensis TaxID=188906 RepID=UPI000B886931|nr:hypothetical protein [Jannaschia helgolandensis]